MLGRIPSQKVILKLRAGDGIVDLAVLTAFMILINWLDQAESFRQIPAPHMDPHGWLTGKYDNQPIPHVNYKSSKFELQMAGVNEDQCPNERMADENGFVMSYTEAYNLVAETYPGFMQVNEDCRISDWQAAKHMYHASGMGIDISE